MCSILAASFVAQKHLYGSPRRISTNTNTKPNTERDNTMQTYSEFSPTGFDSKGLNADRYGIGSWLVLPTGQNRDSDDLEKSNFTNALEMLGGESEDVEVHRFGHWACGWFEIILVTPVVRLAYPRERKQAIQRACATALEIERSLENYPVLNEDDFCDREWSTVCEHWEQMSVSDRIDAIAAHGSCSIFAARRDELPQDDSGGLFDYLRTP